MMQGKSLEWKPPHMSERIWSKVGRVETALALGEWCWRIFAIVSVGGGAIVSGALAKADPILRQMGPFYWWTIAIFTGFLISCVFRLVRSSILQQAQSEYYRSLSAPKSLVNPMLSSFDNLVIPIEDLRMPGRLLHENKHFRNCKFAGPGAIAINGGSFNNSGFIETGPVICVDGAEIMGVVVLKNCTLEKCEFIRVTILADSNTSRGFKRAGGSVHGLTD